MAGSRPHEPRNQGTRCMTPLEEIAAMRRKLDLLERLIGNYPAVAYGNGMVNLSVDGPATISLISMRPPLAGALFGATGWQPSLRSDVIISKLVDGVIVRLVLRTPLEPVIEVPATLFAQ